MKNKIVKMSLVTAMLLTTVVNAGLIQDTVTPSDQPEVNTMFGFGSWNLSNVNVKMTDVDYNPTIKVFDPANGSYTEMVRGDSFESDINNSAGEIVAKLHGKDWPVGEPAGIKVVTGDKPNKGKPGNCIMTTSYLELQNMNDANSGTGYLDAWEDGTVPNPVICSSPFQTHKRFKYNMLPATVADYDVNTRYGKPIDLVFNLDPAHATSMRYQVLEKINNYTGMRLDGYKIEVLNENDVPDTNLTLSIGLGEATDNDGIPLGTDIWDTEDMANFAHGLWGPEDDHFDTTGFFDDDRSGFVVDPSGHGTSTLVGGPTTLAGNYEALFGLWLPSKWAPYGIFWDDDNDPLTDAQLMAFWGTIPGAPEGTSPAWHKGYKDNWAEPTSKELITWTVDPLFYPGHIEDTLNLGLNYIVNVGDNTQIGSKFTIRITPRVAVDQTRPSYIEDDNETYIEPPTSYVASAGVVTISPEPTFTPATDVYVGVADADLNQDAAQAEEVTITVTSNIGDSEQVTLTETGVDSGVFSATLSTENSGSTPSANNGVMSVIEDSVVTATYVDIHYGNTDTTETLRASTIAKTPVVDPDTPVDSDGNTASSGGGGCTYNPNSKNFDMTVLFMMALGLLYPFRRRFLK